MTQPKIGKASYSNGRKNYFKLEKQGDSVFRILPPLGKLADEGIWAVYHKVQYGYSNSKGRMRPFESPEVKNFRTKMIEVEDPASTFGKKLSAQFLEAKNAKNEVLAENIKKLARKYNLDNKWYLNVLDTSGNIGLLKIPHRMKQALDVEIKKLEAKGIDPLSIENGRYFVFTRTGTGTQTTHRAAVYEEELDIPNVGKVKKEKVHVLTDEVLNRLSDEYHELDELFTRPTSEQVKLVVEQEIERLAGKRTDCPAIDSILGVNDADRGASAEEEEVASNDEVDSLVDEASKPASLAPTTSVPVAAKTATPAAETKTVARTEVKVGKSATSENTAAAANSAGAIEKMAPEDFLKHIGLT